MNIIYSLNGILFSSFGIVISGSEGILGLPDRKESLSADWPDDHGTRYDLSRPRYKERELVLEGTMIADSASDYYTKLDFIQYELRKPYTQRLMIQVLNMVLVYEVFLRDEFDPKKQWRPGMMPGAFTLKLIEPAPVKKVIQFTRSGGTTNLSIQMSSPNMLSIYWGDGAVTHNLYGAINVNHTYTADGTYYAIIAGVVEEITGLSTNGTQTYVSTGLEPVTHFATGGGGGSTVDLYAEFPQFTKAQVRALNWSPTDQNTTVKPAYYVTDANPAAIFKFNYRETGADNDSTILVDAAGNRWTRTSIFLDVYDPNR